VRQFAAALAVVLAPALAHAGGFELQEQSARGTAMSGAQTALADDPAAIYYNPAGLTFQRGSGSMASINVIYAATDVTPPNLPQVESNHTAVQPSGFVMQRLGAHFAVGIGLFSNFDQHFNYPFSFAGRFTGYFIDITTATINPTVAIRPIPRLSVGFGLDVVPAMIDIYRALSFGSSEGSVHIGASAVGVGGNVGVLGIVVPRYLTLGVAYRSMVDLDFNGHAAVSAPPELAPLAGGVQVATLTLPLPHNFSFAVASRPVKGLALDFDVHLTLWHDLSTLTVTLTNPAAPPSMQQQTQSTALNWVDRPGFRFGAEYRLLDEEKLALRVGAGYDLTPVPTNTLLPLAPDANRGQPRAGVGGRRLAAEGHQRRRGLPGRDPHGAHGHDPRLSRRELLERRARRRHQPRPAARGPVRPLEPARLQIKDQSSGAGVEVIFSSWQSRATRSS
jgi:long-chain fatty acid transport protein